MHRLCVFFAIFSIFIFFSLQQLTRNNTDVFHFVQVSDIHLSWRLPHRTKNFQTVVDHIKKWIKPDFCLCTGDITDALFFGWWVYQVESEYKDYNQTISEFDEKFWIDVRIYIMNIHF